MKKFCKMISEIFMYGDFFLLFRLGLAYLIGLGFKVSFFYCYKNKVKVKKIISLSGKRQSKKSV